MAESYQELINQQKEAEDKPRTEIIAFCKKNDISSTELMISYQIALGVPTVELLEEGKPLREEIFIVAKMIDKCIKEGYPINRIVDMIEGRSEHEDAPKNFEIMVDTLDISSNEKRLLKAVMNKEREGTLFIYNKDNEKKIVHFSITEAAQKKDYTQNDLAYELMFIINNALRIAGKDGIEVMFELKK